jgi:hypothetical protein
MGKAIVYKNSARKRKYLCFILKPPESRGKNNPIVIAYKRSSGSFARPLRFWLRAGSPRTKKLLPLHRDKSKLPDGYPILQGLKAPK